MITLLHHVTRDLTASPVECKRANWILTAAALAISAASAIYGGVKSHQAAKKAESQAAYRDSAEKAWYDKEYNTDYMDTKAGQNLLRRAQQIQDSYVRKADGAAAVGGGTASSVAQAKESANRAMGETIANMGATDTSRKQQVADKHQSNLNDLSMQHQQIEMQKAQNTTTAAQNMSNAMMVGASGIEDELGGLGLKKKR